MSEQPQAASTPAIEVDRGMMVTMTPDQRTEFRRTGDLPKPPEPPKEEEPAPSPTETSSEETPNSEPTGEEPAGEPEPPKKPQEDRRKPGAEKRIGELTSEVKRLKQELETLKKPAPEPKEQPKPDPQHTRAKPTADDRDKDGNPKFKTYEDFVEDLADWKAEQRWAASQREQQQQAQQRELNARITEAKQRYGEKFDEVLAPTINTILTNKDVSPVVRTMLNESEVLPDLLFTLGSDDGELASFMQMATGEPGKALRYIALTESLIREELAAKNAPKKDPPAKPQTSAPKPPAEVGGRAATPNDALEAAAKAGDFRSYKAEANRRELARLRG